MFFVTHDDQRKRFSSLRKAYGYLDETQGPRWLSLTLVVVAVLVAALVILAGLIGAFGDGQESKRDGVEWLAIAVFAMILARAIYLTVCHERRTIASTSVLISAGFTVLAGPAIDTFMSHSSEDARDWVTLGAYVIGVLFAVAAFEASRQHTSAVAESSN